MHGLSQNWHSELLVRYSPGMQPRTSQLHAEGLWKPHPDDEADVRAAMEAAESDDLLSPAASEAFLRWLEGEDNDSWRTESE